MGYALSWLAVKGKSPEAVLTELGFRPTGARQEIAKSELGGARLPNGWYVVVSDHTAKVAPDQDLDRLSSGDTEIVTCFFEEHVMCSVAIGWKNGRRVWSVIHDIRHGHDHLQLDGELPAEFAPIRERFVAKQREEDQRHPPKGPLPRRTSSAGDLPCDYIFEIPVQLAQLVTGFRHDQDIPGAGPAPFEVLTRTRPAGLLAIPDLDPAHLAQIATATRRSGLKRLAIGSCIFTALLLAVTWLSHSRGIVVALITSVVPLLMAFVGAVETITGLSSRQAAAKWMTLAGWQRGVLGTLIVLAVIVLLGVVITAVVMLLT